MVVKTDRIPAAGNPTSFKGASRTYNSRNQNTAFTFDDNGNPTDYGGASLAYDPEDRMTLWHSGGASVSAAYRSDGLRAWKQVGTTRAYYLGPCELDSSGDVIAVDTFGPNGLLSRRTDASVFYTFDPQGSVVQTLEADGDIITTQLYDAYGAPVSGGNPAPYGYGGQYGYYTDPETGLLLLTHRYYDPAEGRFLTRDPIGYAGGVNLYAYVESNPVNWVDPVGLSPKGETAGPTEAQPAGDREKARRELRDMHAIAGREFWRAWGPLSLRACKDWQQRLAGKWARMNNGAGPNYWTVITPDCYVVASPGKALPYVDVVSNVGSYRMGVGHSWLILVPRVAGTGPLGGNGQYYVDPWLTRTPRFWPNPTALD